nr:MAG TPA: hypothetical protein [Caudoviricetes sp.]
MVFLLLPLGLLYFIYYYYSRLLYISQEKKCDIS